MTRKQIKEQAARYAKFVEWSDEDNCFIGRCPELMLGGVHGNDEATVFLAPFHKFSVARRLLFDLLSSHNCSLFHRIQRPPHVAFLIVLGVVTGAAAHCHPQSFRVREVPMTAFAAPVHKPGLFQVGNQLANLARHFSIKSVSQTAKRVNGVQGRVTSGIR